MKLNIIKRTYVNKEGVTVQADTELKIVTKFGDSETGLVKGDKLTIKPRFVADCKEISFKDKVTGEDKSFRINTVVAEWLDAPAEYLEHKSAYNTFKFRFSSTEKMAAKLFNLEPSVQYVIEAKSFTKDDGQEIVYIAFDKISNALESNTKEEEVIEFYDDTLPFN